MSRSSIYVYYANKLKTVLFTSFHKESIHCTGYLLIQVEIESICKSHYLHWLVSQSCMLTFLLFLECGHSWTVSSVAAGAGAGPSAVSAGAGPSAASSIISAVSASSTFSYFLSAKYRIRHRSSIWCCHEDKVR